MIRQGLQWHVEGGMPWMGAKGITPHQGAQGQADGVWSWGDRQKGCACL